MQYDMYPQRQFPNVQTLRTVWHSSLKRSIMQST